MLQKLKILEGTREGNIRPCCELCFNNSYQKQADTNFLLEYLHKSLKSLSFSISHYRICSHNNEIFAFLGCYAAQIGSNLPTFRDNVSVPSSRVSILIVLYCQYTDSIMQGDMFVHECTSGQYARLQFQIKIPVETKTEVITANSNEHVDVDMLSKVKSHIVLQEDRVGRGGWQRSPTQSQPLHQREVSDPFHAPDPLPRAQSPRTHLIGGQVATRASVDGFVKKKVSSSCSESNRNSWDY